MAHLIFIKLDGNAFTVHPTEACNTEAQTLSTKQGAIFELDVKFSLSATHANLLTAGAVGKLVFKRKDRATAAPTVTDPQALRVINHAWGDDSGSPLKYNFTTTITSPALDADMLLAAYTDYEVDVVWQYPDNQSLYMSIGLIVRVVSAVYVPSEASPNAFFHRGRSVFVDPNFAAMQAAGANAVETWQEAWDYVLDLQTSDPGPAFIMLGSYPTGDAGSATVPGSTIADVTIIGLNAATSRWSGMVFDAGASVTLEVLHCQGFMECRGGTVVLTGMDAIILTPDVSGYLDYGDGHAIAAGSISASGPGLVLSGALLGGASPDPASDGVNGRVGGAAGVLTLAYGARATSPDLKPGAGGLGGEGFGDAGDGGNAGAPGTLNVGTGCECTDPDLSGSVGGDGPTASGADGDGGDGSNAGTINQAVGSVVTGAIMVPGAAGVSYGSGVAGAAGSAGVHNGYALAIPDINSAPAADPISGGVLYFEGGALKYRKADGSVKTVTVS